MFNVETKSKIESFSAVLNSYENPSFSVNALDSREVAFDELLEQFEEVHGISQSLLNIIYELEGSQKKG